MTPHKQTILHSETTQGNCWQAVIASYADLPIDEVPHFVLKDTWWNDTIDFMKERRMALVIDPPIEVFPYTIAVGKTIRGTQHSVIYKNGEPFFDPHPSDDFLLKEEYSIAFKKY